MRAIVRDGYGGVDGMRLEETERPSPARGEVLVRVEASSINAADWIDLSGKPYAARLMTGLIRPKWRVPGRDVVGIVEATGEGVTRFDCGDRVFGQLDGGAYASYARCPEDRVVRAPDGVTPEVLATLPLAGVTAMQALRLRGAMGSGERVLVNGAAGSVGGWTVQIALSMGVEVHAVCSGASAGFVRGLGASRVFDYTREDVCASGERYERVIDLVGNRRMRAWRGLLTKRGVFVAASGGLEREVVGPFVDLARVLVADRLGTQRFAPLISTPDRAILDELGAMAADGRLSSTITRRVTLEGLADAMREQGTGHARGKTVVLVQA
ncbi:MAG: NAD(P)-dependent alcohol dehydrogenase [Phycisphaerales bacterium]